MSEEIFRKKSLEKIQSPENLTDCVRVPDPGVWLLLVAAAALAAGALLWFTVGKPAVDAAQAAASAADAPAVVSVADTVSGTELISASDN